MEVLFDAGYAVPEWRGDDQSPAPTRDWLVGLGEAGWKPLTAEAERYLRECLQLTSGGKVAEWQVEFIDFRTRPPDFPELLNEGAYVRIRVTGASRLDAGAVVSWQAGVRPDLVLKLPGKDGGYLALGPGQSASLPMANRPVGGRWPWIESFRQGFLHVVPTGVDHLLLVIGLFFYHRAWRPLLLQSLAFTLAHTVTLGLAASGWVRIPNSWVDLWIALSLIAVAVENLRATKKECELPRLALVFGFGLVHGLGFAGALSVWLAPGAGFLPALLAANLGVEAAQATVLGAAWLLTMGLSRTPYYRGIRIAGCLVIAATGVWWAVDRLAGMIR
jgi:hypothetical protein